MQEGEVSLEDFLLKEHEQSHRLLRHMDNALSTYLWLYIGLIVAIAAVIGILIGLTGVGPDLLLFISFASVLLFLIGVAVLQFTLHIKDRQNLIASYIQEMVFYFMGKGLKPVGGAPRNLEAARILDFKFMFDDSHRNNWHMRRRDHIQGYGSPDEAGDAWTSNFALANKMMNFMVILLAGLVAVTVATFASGVIWGKASDYEASMRSAEFLYFGCVLGMEFFVASWIVFRYTLRTRMKAKREFADEAFRRKKEQWFKTSPNPGKVEDMIESTISRKKVT